MWSVVPNPHPSLILAMCVTIRVVHFMLKSKPSAFALVFIEEVVTIIESCEEEKSRAV